MKKLVIFTYKKDAESGLVSKERDEKYVSSEHSDLIFACCCSELMTSACDETGEDYSRFELGRVKVKQISPEGLTLVAFDWKHKEAQLQRKIESMFKAKLLKWRKLHK